MNNLAMDTRAVNSLIPSAVLTVLAIGLVTARFGARARILGRLEPSDWVVAASLFFSVSLMAMLIAETKFGMGWHESDLPPEILTKQLIIFWLSLPVYNIAMVLAKVSIFLQYPRLFQTKTMHILCRATISTIAIFGLWAVLSALLHCIPVAKSWYPKQLAGYCLSNEILWFVNSGVYIITDLVIMVTPISSSFSLYLSLRQKLALCVMFASGGLVLIISIIRLQSVRVLSTSSDFIYDSPSFSMWSSIECSTGIICACLPTLRPLLSRVWPSIIPDLDTSRSQTRPSSRTLAYRSRQIYPADHIELARLRQDSRANSFNYHNVDELSRRLPVPGNAFAEDLYRKGTLF
ncbi:hypothetical protein PISL3812_04278 [Talaromyces islandicus]|uniref:Rhodopsin domain-containing protein n=1 Tax=Talaromyces islandicus TaxID=28573 RepID=A0A0U1LX69_TALIS|nr:hypothetical protein PISL3812_04278 [Talaromyces islandicus]